MFALKKRTYQKRLISIELVNFETKTYQVMLAHTLYVQNIISDETLITAEFWLDYVRTLGTSWQFN